MALQEEGPAPYTSPSAVIALVERFRDRGLTTPIDLDVLVRAGISEGLAPRTLYALRQLDLISEQGEPTEALEGLRLAPSDTYRERFAEVVRAAYSPIFQYVDPASDSIDRVRDAFRPYTPFGQQGRMVTLFLGLCEHAGITAGRPRTAPEPRRAPGRPRQHPAVTRTRAHAQAAQQVDTQRQSEVTGDVPQTLIALMQEALPARGSSWTAEQRDRFLATFKVLLDFSVPVGEQTALANDGEAMP